MIARYRKQRMIYFLLLVVAVAGMSVGFASFSSELTISSNAIVKPDYGDFRVVFSSSGTNLATDGVTGIAIGDATAGTASIENDGATPAISDLTATFTGPGQSVKYEFYAYNSGAYVAHLTEINFSNVSGENSNKICSSIDGSLVTSSLIDNACNDINVTIDIGESTFGSSTTGISGHSLDKSLFESIIITITYSDNGNSADGDFTVEFGDIELTYSSV